MAFLQGDSFSPVEFCLTGVCVAIILSYSKGYRFGPSGRRDIKRTHSLFIINLKIHQPSYERLKRINVIIVQASLDTGACDGVKTWAENVFSRGKIVKGEGLDVLDEMMNSLYPYLNKSYKFLEFKHAEPVEADAVYKRVSKGLETAMKTLTDKQLHKTNLVKVINSRVIPVASYLMNVYNFTKKQLDELDKVIKQEL